jgi:hypothetical protein
MVRLTDDELALMMDAARPLPIEERDGFRRTLAAELERRDLASAIRAALAVPARFSAASSHLVPRDDDAPTGDG